MLVGTLLYRASMSISIKTILPIGLKKTLNLILIRKITFIFNKFYFYYTSNSAKYQ